MANISAAQVKELREKTGAPMMDCKQALTEAKGDMEQAVVILRKKGVSVAAKKATRVTSEGAVTSYIHAGGKIGVLVEVNCESDFVARTDDFKELVHDIAMHIAASDPKYVRKEDVTPADFEREKEIFLAQAVASGKPPQHRREDGHRQDGEVLRRGLPAGAALHQGPDHLDRAADCGEDRQAGREHRGAALRALQGGRCRARPSPSPSQQNRRRSRFQAHSSSEFHRNLAVLALVAVQPFET